MKQLSNETNLTEIISLHFPQTEFNNKPIRRSIRNLINIIRHIFCNIFLVTYDGFFRFFFFNIYLQNLPAA